MKVYRIKLRPLSAWRTPWQADTLAGLLCSTMARTQGAEALRREVLEPCLRGEPPFVLSDAFPGDLLPLPEIVRLQRWSDDSLRQVKRARWLKTDAFRQAQRGENVAVGDLLADDVLKPSTHLHNTLDRLTDTTGAQGSLYPREETVLIESQSYLSVYARVEEGFLDTLFVLFRALSDVGFGADVSTGKGQFEVEATGFEPVDWLDEVTEVNGVIALSTFQPNESDPTEGFWEAFAKFGKVGPDFGLKNVFKRPLVMLRAGACLFTPERKAILGRAIDMEGILSDSNCHRLRGAGVALVHLAYGLAVPAHFSTEG